MQRNFSQRNEEIMIENQQTFLFSQNIGELDEADVFICEPTSQNKRYAFSINELEQAIDLDQFKFTNVYTNKLFSESDLTELALRSKKIKAHMDHYIESNRQTLESISRHTLEEMQKFISGAKYYNIDDETVIENLKRHYSEEELKQLGGAGVTLGDLVRKDAFIRFHHYYDELSEEEKNALDSIPEVRKLFHSYNITTFNDIFFLAA